MEMATLAFMFQCSQSVACMRIKWRVDLKHRFLRNWPRDSECSLRICFWWVFFFFFFAFFFFLRATAVAYGGSQARGLIGAAAAGLHHSHSNAGSELHLRSTPQLMATPDP